MYYLLVTGEREKRQGNHWRQKKKTEENIKENSEAKS